MRTQLFRGQCQVVAPQMFPLLPVVNLVKFQLFLPHCLVVLLCCPRNGAGELPVYVLGNPGELLLARVDLLIVRVTMQGFTVLIQGYSGE